MDAHKLSLSLKDHPDIAAALTGASAGDTITIKELKVMIDEIGEDHLVGSVCDCSKDISIKEAPDKPKATGEASEEITAPVLSVMAPGYKKKR